jgi:hypothetical protein
MDVSPFAFIDRSFELDDESRFVHQSTSLFQDFFQTAAYATSGGSRCGYLAPFCIISLFHICFFIICQTRFTKLSSQAQQLQAAAAIRGPSSPGW